MKARDNPFSTDRVLRLRYRVPSWPALLERLSGLHYRAAIVGPEGAGKTTLLEDLAPHLTARGFDVLPLFINRDTPRRARSLRAALRGRLTPNTIVLLDGAEQMSRWQWFRFRLTISRAAGLVITSHQPGMLPTLVECRTSPKLLDSLLHELVGDAATSLRERSHDLFATYHGNVRDVFRALYDDAAVADTVDARPAAERCSAVATRDCSRSSRRL